MDLQLPRQLQEEAVIEGNIYFFEKNSSFGIQGSFTEADLKLIAKGVKSSTQITRDIMKLFE